MPSVHDTQTLALTLGIKKWPRAGVNWRQEFSRKQNHEQHEEAATEIQGSLAFTNDKWYSWWQFDETTVSLSWTPKL